MEMLSKDIRGWFWRGINALVQLFLASEVRNKIYASLMYIAGHRLSFSVHCLRPQDDHVQYMISPYGSERFPAANLQREKQGLYCSRDRHSDCLKSWNSQVSHVGFCNPLF